MKTTRTRTSKPNLIVSQGEGWHVAYDRVTKDYAAYVGGEYLGSTERQHEAQQLINAYRYRQLGQVAA